MGYQDRIDAAAQDTTGLQEAQAEAALLADSGIITKIWGMLDDLNNTELFQGQGSVSCYIVACKKQLGGISPSDALTIFPEFFRDPRIKPLGDNKSNGFEVDFRLTSRTVKGRRSPVSDRSDDQSMVSVGIRYRAGRYFVQVHFHKEAFRNRMFMDYGDNSYEPQVLRSNVFIASLDNAFYLIAAHGHEI